jgi:hypothetical protein
METRLRRCFGSVSCRDVNDGEADGNLKLFGEIENLLNEIGMISILATRIERTDSQRILRKSLFRFGQELLAFLQKESLARTA